MCVGGGLYKFYIFEGLFATGWNVSQVQHTQRLICATSLGILTGGRLTARVIVCISDVMLSVLIHSNTTEVLRHSKGNGEK